MMVFGNPFEKTQNRRRTQSPERAPNAVRYNIKSGPQVNLTNFERREETICLTITEHLLA